MASVTATVAPMATSGTPSRGRGARRGVSSRAGVGVLREDEAAEAQHKN